MITVFKILYILICLLIYSAWILWCYNNFGINLNSECILSWAGMLFSMGILGVLLTALWESLFEDEDSGVPLMNNPPPPPKRKENV